MTSCCNCKAETGCSIRKQANENALALTSKMCVLHYCAFTDGIRNAEHLKGKIFEALARNCVNYRPAKKKVFAEENYNTDFR